MKNTLFALWLTIILLIIGCEAKKSNIDTFNKYISAHNSHNVSKTIKCFSNNATFELPGQDTLLGIDKILSLEEWDAALNSNLKVSSFVERGDTLIVNSIIERNDLFKNMGIDSVVYNPGTRIVFKDGLIKAIKPSPLLQESRERIINKLQMFMNWAKLVRPDELKVLLPDGKFIYKKKNAIKWVTLLKEWRTWGH
ncbi:hypothetical protein BMS3Abin03_01871 [bacterium BMS3Abin03]|nr:hypothetical protein BMS3Abin03_01871 [bacterium BMS3Abin03]